VTKPDLQEARTALEQVLREIEAAAQVLAREEPAVEDEQVDGPHDDVDESTELRDLNREDLVLEAAEDRRVEVQAALDRIDAGTYGSCIDCGKPIDPARLEYRPEAARCLPDQEKYETTLH
jgi:DnaK suppressor protein